MMAMKFLKRTHGTQKQIGRPFPVREKKHLPPRISVKDGKFAPKTFGQPNIFTFKQGQDVVKALSQYASRERIPVASIRLVGGINIRGYSHSDVDIVIEPDEAMERIDDDMIRGKIELPQGITHKNVDLFRAVGAKSEQDWLSDMVDPMLKRGFDQEHFKKSLEEARKLQGMPVQAKRWRGRAALAGGKIPWIYQWQHDASQVKRELQAYADRITGSLGEDRVVIKTTSQFHPPFGKRGMPPFGFYMQDGSITMSVGDEPRVTPQHLLVLRHELAHALVKFRSADEIERERRAWKVATKTRPEKWIARFAIGEHLKEQQRRKPSIYIGRSE